LIQELEELQSENQEPLPNEKLYILLIVPKTLWTKIETRDCSFEYEKNNFLLEMKCKLCCCNTATTNAIQELREI
jgi:hypothetical protein